MPARPAFVLPLPLSVPHRPAPTPARRPSATPLCASTPPPARGAAAAAGQASPLPPALAALVAAQRAAPLYGGTIGAAAQAATPPAYLADAELPRGAAGAAAARLRDARENVVGAARDAIYAGFPGISEDGGALWPEFRADACWRDMDSFVRVVHYGCAGEGRPWVSRDGGRVMDRAYDQLEVPKDAMCVGIQAAARYADDVLYGEAAESDGEARAARECTRAAFAELIALMEAMRDGRVEESERERRVV